MNEEADDFARVLAAILPRKAPAGLRKRVLGAVSAELSANHPEWTSRIGRAVAATFLFSVVTGIGVSVYEQRRMADWDRRIVVRSDIADLTAAIASVTDQESANSVRQYLLAQIARRPRPASEAVRAALREIERWAENNHLVDRSEADAQAENRT